MDEKEEIKQPEDKKIKREVKKEKEEMSEKKSNFYKAKYALSPTGKKKFPEDVLKHYWKRTTIDTSKREFYGEVEAKIDTLQEVPKEFFEKVVEKFGLKK